ncbi:DUF2523 family protein [Acinetobacter haemolyticus]|uniref:DUF2523 family protein n=1 Tax=Acinetobacter TaxID=469 RepID=UPI0030F3BED7
MPALAPILMWFASTLVASIILRLFVGAGLSVVSFIFINDLVSQARDSIQNAFYGLPADVLSFVQLYKVDQAISVILSALTIAAYIKTAKVFVGRSS